MNFEEKTYNGKSYYTIKDFNLPMTIFSDNLFLKVSFEAKKRAKYPSSFVFALIYVVLYILSKKTFNV